MTIKVGDKIRYIGPSGSDLTHGKVYEVEGVLATSLKVLDDVGNHNGIPRRGYYEPVTDTPAPTLWRDMTDAEKGALLLAKHQGKVIESWAHGGLWIVLEYPAWDDHNAYRVAEPEPVVETVKLIGGYGCGWGFYSELEATNETHRITFDLIDGKPDPDSIRMESTT